MRSKIRSVVAGTALIAASVAAGQSPRRAPIFDLGGAVGWLNSVPLSGKSPGKVANRFLDLHLHQLPAAAALREELGCKI